MKPIGCLAASGVWLLLAGCGLKAVDPSTLGPMPDDELARQQAETAVRATLFDPDAGQFKNWSAVHQAPFGLMASARVWAICVDVNGKNRYGGYTGFKTFRVSFEGGAVATAPGAITEMPYGCTSLPSAG